MLKVPYSLQYQRVSQDLITYVKHTHFTSMQMYMKCVYTMLFYDYIFIICYSEILIVYLCYVHIYVNVKESQLEILKMTWFSAGELAQ